MGDAFCQLLEAVDGDECGVRATCLDAACVCDEGFFESLDLLIVSQTGGTDCLMSINIAMALLIISVFPAIASIIIQTRRCRGDINPDTVAPYLVSTFLMTYSLAKAANIEERVIGEDPVVTIPYALLFAAIGAGEKALCAKFIMINYQSAMFKGDGATEFIRRLDKLLVFLALSSVVGGILIITTPFVADRDAASLLMRAGVGIVACVVFSNSLIHAKLCHILVTDIAEDSMNPERYAKAVTRIKRINAAFLLGPLIGSLFLMTHVIGFNGFGLYFNVCATIVAQSGLAYIMSKERRPGGQAHTPLKTPDPNASSL